MNAQPAAAPLFGQAPVESLQAKVEALLRAKFPEADLNLETEPNGVVHGYVVTDRFRHWLDRTRVGATRAPLKALPKAERESVSMLMALTHAEYQSIMDDQRFW